MKFPAWFLGFLAAVLPTKADSPETRLFKRTAYTIIGMIFLMGLFVFATFFFALEGDEDTMVPRLIGEDLVTALQDLQEKELVPKIQVRFSSDPREKGTVIGQEPGPGTLVKAGRKVLLTISKGAIVDKIESYVGQTLNDVRMHLQTIFATTAPLIRIKDNQSYIFNSAPAGTILEQKPAAGTQVSSLTDLEFVVSRGPRGQTVKIGTYTGRTYSEVVKQMLEAGIPFAFKARKAAGSEVSGLVVSQDPSPGVEVPKGKIVELVMTNLGQLSEGRVFGIFDYNLPEYPIMVDLKLNLLKPTGERENLVTMKHPGGHVAIPYIAQDGDTLSLEIFDKELMTFKVTP